jgi:HAD superfamily hydrolase (TIGR01490 family)
MARAAFFDMDRTLVRVNTARLYVRWRMKRREIGLRTAARAMLWLAQYKLGVVDATSATTEAARALAGRDEASFAAECRTWYEETVRPHVSETARAEVERRRRAGDLCVVLTASTPYGTVPLAEDLGIEHVICSRLEIEDGTFTGRCAEPICYGDGKVTLAERWAREHGVSLADAAFYTDSVSDLPMLMRVGEPRVVNPDPRLRLSAAARGWPVERWT